jgi:hypothetical protein
MIKKFREWFGLCSHQWVDFKEIDVYDSSEYRVGKERPIGTIYVLRCSKCGDMKQVKVSF